MEVTFVQKIDAETLKKNPDGSSTVSITDPHPSFPQSKISLLKLGEDEAIDWLIRTRRLRMLLNELFEQNQTGVYMAKELKEPFTDPKKIPGDLDIVLYKNPDLSIGIECKLIKYTLEKEAGDFSPFNKLSGIDKGWEQLEGYSKLGFHKTYLLLIVLDDQSTNENLSQVHRTLQNSVITKLRNLDRKSDSGIIIFFISQISKFDFNVQNVVRLDHHKQAVPYNQSEKLTEMIIANKDKFSRV